MGSDEGETELLHLSSDRLPERDRLAVWREEFGRVLRLDIDAVPNVPFHADLKLRPLSGLSLASGTFCGTRERRTRELITDGNDSLALMVNLAGSFIASQRGHESKLGDGDAFFVSCAETSDFVRPSFGRTIGVVLPHAALAPHVRIVDDAIGRMIPRNNAALKLMTSYMGTLEEVLPAASPELRRAAATHLLDLVALTIGATADAAFIAAGRGVSAARLAAIKLDIVQGLGRRDVSVAAVAARHRVTPRHIHRLFEAEGTSFSQFVLDLRLARAHRMLGDRRFAHWTIKAIVYDTGFGDRSYFNRAFRRRYGASPSDLRAAMAGVRRD